MKIKALPILLIMMEDKWPSLSLDWVEKDRYTVTNFQNNLRWTNNQSGEHPSLFQSPLNEQDAQLWDFIPLGRGDIKLPVPLIQLW